MAQIFFPQFQLINTKKMAAYFLKFLTIFFLIHYAVTLKGQISPALIRKAITESIFLSEFNVCKLDSILLYDKNKIITIGDSLLTCGIKVNIVRDSIYNVKPCVYSPYKVSSLIILYNIVSENNKVTLSFWRPYSGANLKLRYKACKGKYILTHYEVGTF